MRVARVEIRADVTSFRYPFFVTGRQPTFDVPPPSTIHGHCASALGDWPDPKQFFFGLHFRYRARGEDLEHQHLATALGPKTRTMVSALSGPERATTEISIQPVVREFLFGVEMILYVDPALASAFRTPMYPVVLGRSQDLAEVKSVTEIELERSDRLRLEHTLLPMSVRPSVRLGAAVLLSRYIAPPPKRDVVFGQYIALHDTVFLGDEEPSMSTFDRIEGISPEPLWCDPTILDDDGRPRGVWIHRLFDP